MTNQLLIIYNTTSFVQHNILYMLESQHVIMQSQNVIIQKLVNQNNNLEEKVQNLENKIDRILNILEGNNVVDHLGVENNIPHERNEIIPDFIRT